MTPDDYIALFARIRLAGGQLRLFKKHMSKAGEHRLHVSGLGSDDLRDIVEGSTDMRYSVQNGATYQHKDKAIREHAVLCFIPDEGDIPPELIEKINHERTV